MGTFIKIPLRACILAAALLIVSASCSAPQQGRKTVYSDGREHFVLITDAVPDVILEIRYFGTYNFVGSRIDGYMRPVAFLTQEAAARLLSSSPAGMSSALMSMSASSATVSTATGSGAACTAMVPKSDSSMLAVRAELMNR